MKKTSWATVILLSLCITACKTSKQQSQTTTTIGKIKELRNSPSFKAEDGKKEYYVEGYFYNDRVPLLVTDLKWTQINTPMPDSVYIVLGGPVLKALADSMDKYQGSFIRVKGVINTTQKNNDIEDFTDFICPDLPIIIRPVSKAFIIPRVINLCRIFPRICTTFPVLSRNYALLYSGGYNQSNAHLRYWNDLKFMYRTLKSQYGYTDEQIIVVYKSGTAEDSDMPVDYAASITGLNSAFTYLSSRLTVNADFFVFVTNHGGGYHNGENANRGGIADGNPPDEIDPRHYDETIYYYSQSPNEITDDFFTAKVNALHFRKLVAVLEPCFSGGFLYDLRGANRSIISASTEFEYSWAGAPGNHDMFSYYFTAALNKARHDGVVVNADTNGDGKISMLEAFLYAKQNDSAAESPQLEDTGDGIGSNSPSGAAGAEGAFSKITFL